ncbi:MAG: HNH endonuclease [Candidatus Thorarchaeota archaeon]
MFKRKKKTFTDKKGYRRFGNSGKLVHRWVAGAKPGQVVHHKNRRKSDNRPSNLRVFSSQKEHHATHRRRKKKWGTW